MPATGRPRRAGPAGERQAVGPAWRIAAAVWTVVVVVSGVLPTQGAVHAVSAGRDDQVTTVAHFGTYVVLGFLFGVAFGGWAPRARDLAAALALAVAVGVGIELVQGPLPYRDLQLSDALADAAGAALGLAALSAVALARRPRSRRG